MEERRLNAPTMQHVFSGDEPAEVVTYDVSKVKKLGTVRGVDYAKLPDDGSEHAGCEVSIGRRLEPSDLTNDPSPREVRIKTKQRTSDGRNWIVLVAKLVDDGTYERKRRQQMKLTEPAERVARPVDALAELTRAIPPQYIPLSVGTTNPLVDHRAKRLGLRKNTPGYVETGGREALDGPASWIAAIRQTGSRIELVDDDIVVDETKLSYELLQLLANPDARRLFKAELKGTPEVCKWPHAVPVPAVSVARGGAPICRGHLSGSMEDAA